MNHSSSKQRSTRAAWSASDKRRAATPTRISPASSNKYEGEEEMVRRRFETTLIEERARLKSRLDSLESEHQTLLGNVRRLQSSILTMQEDTVRVVSEKTRLAERWHGEAGRLFACHAAVRDEADELRLQQQVSSERVESCEEDLVACREDLSASRAANDRLSRGVLVAQSEAHEAGLVRDELLRQLKELRERHETVELRCEAVGAEHTAQAQRAQGLEGHLQEARHDHSLKAEGHAAEKVVLETKLEVQGKEAEALQLKLEGKDAELGEKAAQLEELGERHEALESAHESTTAELLATQNLLGESKRISEERAEKLKRTEEELRLTKVSVGDQASALVELSDSLASLKNALANTRVEVQAVRQQLTKSEDERGRLEEALCLGEKKLARTTVLKEALRKELDELHNEMEATRGDRDTTKRALNRLDQEFRNLESSKSDTETSLGLLRTESSAHAANLASRLAHTERVKSEKEAALLAVEENLGDTEKRLQQTEAESLFRFEENKKNLMRRAYKRYFAGGVALRKALNTWAVASKQISLGVATTARLQALKEASEAKLFAEATEERERLRLEHEENVVALQEERRRHHEEQAKRAKDQASTLATKHEAALAVAHCGKAQVEATLAEAAVVRVSATMKRMVFVRRLRRAWFAWGSNAKAVRVLETTTRSLCAEAEAKSLEARQEQKDSVSALRSLHASQLAKSAEDQAEALSALDREIRTLRLEFGEAQQSLSVSKATAERELASERGRARKLAGDLARSTQELATQKLRTAEVSHSVAEIQRRLGQIALNPMANLSSQGSGLNNGVSQGGAVGSSPSRQLHQRSSAPSAQHLPKPSPSQVVVTTTTGGGDTRSSFSFGGNGGGAGGGTSFRPQLQQQQQPYYHQQQQQQHQQQQSSFSSPPTVRTVITATGGGGGGGGGGGSVGCGGCGGDDAAASEAASEAGSDVQEARTLFAARHHHHHHQAATSTLSRDLDSAVGGGVEEEEEEEALSAAAAVYYSHAGVVPVSGQRAQAPRSPTTPRP